MEIKEYITDYDQLFDSMLKCKKNVSWKPSVKSFVLNGVENCLKMEEQLQNDTWINRKPKPIVVTYPKRRECLSIPFRDRVYQRSINDNSLYPQTTKHFVYTNIACQKFKGTKKAMDVMRQYLHKLNPFLCHRRKPTTFRWWEEPCEPLAINPDSQYTFV